MNETSAIPIMSAAAVAAVRPGFLRAFSPPVRAAMRSGITPGNSIGHSGSHDVSALRSAITSTIGIRNGFRSTPPTRAAARHGVSCGPQMPKRRSQYGTRKNGHASTVKPKTAQRAIGLLKIAIGRTTREAKSATPRKSRSTPTAIEISRSAVPSSSTNIARPSSTSDRATTSPPIQGTNGASREGGSDAPSRTAAIGGTRVARMAGKSPAASVTPTPMSSETMTVRAAKTRSAEGSSNPRARKSASIPSASSTPSARPTSEARNPMTSDSRITDVRTCRREAPIVRSVANSRVRCATVIENVLKMTNAPTNREMPAKARKK